MKILLRNSAFIISFLLPGCQSQLTPEKYVSYFDKHARSLAKGIERNGVLAQICYIPSDYYAAREAAARKNVNVDSIKTKYIKSIYFLVSVKPGKDNPNRNLPNSFLTDQSARANDQSFSLVSDRDTVSSAAVLSEKTWNISDEKKLLVSFTKSRIGKSLHQYHFLARNLDPALGTIDMPLKDIVMEMKKLKG